VAELEAVGNVTSAATLQALLDRERIREVLARVARSIDRLDLELMASCYTSDAVDERHGVERPIAEFVAWVEPLLRSFASTLHQLTTQLIEVDGDVARVETYCVARHVACDGDGGPGEVWFTYLRYVDSMARDGDGRWLIRHRFCAYEPGTVNLTTLEPLPAAALGGSRDRDDPAYRRA